MHGKNCQNRICEVRKNETNHHNNNIHSNHTGIRLCYMVLDVKKGGNSDHVNINKS